MSSVKVPVPLMRRGSSRRRIPDPKTVALIVRPINVAASRTERTMFWYPVQRQRLPSSAWRTSVAVGFGIVRQERDRRQDHPGRAEPALQPVLGPERLLDRVHRAVLREPFDGLDRGPVSLDGELGTRLHRLVVDEHRARAALAGVAADLRAGQRRDLSEEVDEQEPRFDLALEDPAVHGDPNWKLQRGLPAVMSFACVRTAGILCPSARGCKGREHGQGVRGIGTARATGPRGRSPLRWAPALCLFLF